MKNKKPDTVSVPLNVKILYPGAVPYEQIQLTPEEPVWIEIPFQKHYFTNWKEITAMQLSSGNPEIPEKRLSIEGLKYLRDKLDILRNIQSSNFKEEEIDEW
jgi:hypothetical protein